MWNECEHRVELLASGDTAEVDNFGGEGTGLKTMLEVDWRLGETITLVVTGIQDRAVNVPSHISRRKLPQDHNQCAAIKKDLC